MFGCCLFMVHSPSKYTADDACCWFSACASLAMKCRARLCGSATDWEVPTGMSQSGPLPLDALAYTGDCHAGLWRQGRSASCGDSQHCSMRCPVPSFARECMLTDLVQLFYLLQASSFRTFCAGDPVANCVRLPAHHQDISGMLEA